MCRDKREELRHCSALKYVDYCEEFQLDLQALQNCGCEKAAFFL